MKKTASLGKSSAKSAVAVKGSEKVRVLELKKSQVLQIAMAKLPAADDIRKALVTNEESLSTSELESLLEVLPSSDVLQMIRDAATGSSQLDKPEAFLLKSCFI